MAHPAVYDAVVAGRPSERWGNEVVAVVQLRPGTTADGRRPARRSARSTSPATSCPRTSCSSTASRAARRARPTTAGRASRRSAPPTDHGEAPMSSRRSTRRDVKHHRVPAWWSDAKLGIFVHWTPASVPAFAPVDVDMGELMARRDPHAMAWSPYAEWYQNSMRFPDSPVARHHAEVYGDKPYDEFAGEWEAALDALGSRWLGGSLRRDRRPLRGAGDQAPRRLLPLAHRGGEPARHPGFNSRRDVVGEMGEAVRARGMRFGVYYSGGLDWTFESHPIGTFSDLIAAQPRGAYVAYAEAHVRELIRALPAERPLERHLVAGADRPAGRPAGRLLRGRARRRGERPLHAVVAGLAPGRNGGRPRRARPAGRPLGPRRQGHRASQATAVRRAHPRVHDLRPGADDAVGVRARASTAASATTGPRTKRTSCPSATCCGRWSTSRRRAATCC